MDSVLESLRLNLNRDLQTWNLDYANNKCGVCHSIFALTLSNVSLVIFKSHKNNLNKEREKQLEKILVEQ